jgi:hypothetical protein
MDKPYLLLDIDGVCLDWMGGFVDFMSANLPNFDPDNIVDPHTHSLGDRFGIDNAVATSLMWEFHYDESFTKLKPLDKATESLAKLRQHYRFVAITACGRDEAIKKNRVKNLEDVFGPVFEEVHCVDQFNDKQKFLGMYPASHWVEDHVANSHLGLEFGHQCWLITDSANKHKRIDSRITRIRDLGDLLPALI